LKPRYDEPLSNCASKINLRRYSQAKIPKTLVLTGIHDKEVHVNYDVDEVGSCRLTLSNPRCKRLEPIS
jgi:hypothetical protein